MLKKLAGCIREYKLPTILTPVFMVGEVAMECLIPFLISKLLEQIENGADLKNIATYGLLMVLMAVLSLMFGALAGTTCAKASCGFAKNLRHDMFNNVLNFSFENIDKFSTSSLVTRLTTDVSNVQMAFMMIIRTAVRSPLMMIFSCIMAFTMGGKVAFVFTLTMPILIFGLIIIAKKAMPIFKRVFKKYDTLNASVQENVKGMRVVKSFVREDFEKKKFNRASGEVALDFTRAERILALNNPIMQLCLYTNMVLILLIGSRLIISSNQSLLLVTELSALITYGFQILMSLQMLSMIFVMITMSAESARRICEVIDEKSTLSNPENPVFEIKDGSIQFKDVSFKYSKNAKRMALENINLTINSGETVGVIGGTGSSKSTLVQLISRLYDTTDGTVFVGGRDVKEYDLDTLRNAVAVVLQKNVLFSGTIKENLRWGNENATDEEMVLACKMACADEFIRTFPDGYDTFIEQGGANVSGGQRQRLCIARALLKSPKVIILDDSTSAVDTKTDAMIRKAFKEYIPDTTKIIIAQRIASVMEADKIIVMDNGKISAVGNHETLMKESEIYREVYTSQNKGGEEE